MRERVRKTERERVRKTESERVRRVRVRVRVRERERDGKEENVEAKCLLLNRCLR